MTRPRQVLPDQFVFVTRRCLERRFFLRPDEAVVQTIEYLLAVGLQAFGVRLVALVCSWPRP